MSKKAFIATIEIQLAVWAETETEAQQLAFDSLSNEVMHPGDVQIQPMTFQPDGWEGDCILYSSGEEEVTVKEVLDRLKTGVNHG